MRTLFGSLVLCQQELSPTGEQTGEEQRIADSKANLVVSPAQVSQ